MTLAVSPDIKCKLCCIGDGGVGKTCLLARYTTSLFPQDYIPTVFETHVLNKTFQGKVVEFALYDTAGQEEYDRLRPLSYPDTDVVLVCFACDYPPSLENIEDKWYPEIVHYLGGVPLVLVATKIDMRSDDHAINLLGAQGRAPISREDGQAAARRLQAQYCEVSSKTGDGVEQVFQLALSEAFRYRKQVRSVPSSSKRKRCLIL